VRPLSVEEKKSLAPDANADVPLFITIYRKTESCVMSNPVEPSKPNRLIVSLQVGGVFFALANVICVALLVYAYLAVKLEPKTLDVKGSAKKAIVSDTISWYGTYSTRDADL
jgi:hypothetical protein